MSPDAFGYLAYLLQLVIQKQNTTFRKAIAVKERLVGTLCDISTGGSQQLLSWSNRIGKTPISKIIKETTNAIWEVLHDACLKRPQEMENWVVISDKFETLWNFHAVLEQSMENMLPSNVPNCLGRNI